MLKLILLFFILSIFIINGSDNQLLAGNHKTILFKENYSSNQDSLITSNDTEMEKPDSSLENSLYIPVSEFYYAGNPRYTISGNLPYKDTHLKLIPSLIFVGTYTTAFVAQHIWQLNTIWDTLGPFKFMEDVNQDMYVDKYGHAFGSYYTSYLLRESLVETGLSWEASTILGCFLGLSYSSYIEILDGYGEGWGFSPTDFYADVAGALFFVSQHYVPFLQNFTPKFMYLPASWHGERERIPHEFFNDDYSSQTFFLSINVHNMLPESAKPYWPDWLQLCVGYTARNLVAYGNFIENDPMIDVKKPEVWGSPRYILALDYDLVKALPGDWFLWNWFKQSLNHFKLPSPAVEFSASKTRYYLIYPFRF